MKELYKNALESYITMFELHMDTKTTDGWFHESTEAFYKALFEISHEIWERFVDLGWNITDLSLEDKMTKSNKIITDLRKNIENFAESGKASLWTKSLLWELSSKLENIEWSSKEFLK